MLFSYLLSNREFAFHYRAAKLVIDSCIAAANVFIFVWQKFCTMLWISLFTIIFFDAFFCLALVGTYFFLIFIALIEFAQV